jgi:hypothetical protein
MAERTTSESYARPGSCGAKILQAQIDAEENEYGVDSLDGRKESAKLPESPDSTGDIQQTIGEWEPAEYRLNTIVDTIQNDDVEGVRE